MEYKKGKKNKLKIGDEVEFTPECVEWFATHLVDNYSQAHDCYYKREILKNLGDIHGWLDAYLSKKMPKGKVIGYGADDEIKGFNNVRVRHKFKHGWIEAYYSEVTSVKKLKKVKKC